MAVPPREAVMHVVIFLFSFMVLQHPWLYPWDSVDLLLFTLLAYGILSGAPFRRFLLLFVVGIVNRESALLIAVFIALDAFEIDARHLRLKVIAAWKLLAGGGLLAGGMIYTRLVRQALFISRADGTTDTAHEMIGNHLNLLANLKPLFFYNFLEGQAVYSIAILGMVCYFTSRWREMGDRQIKCFLMLLAILLNILLFGLTAETRLYFIAIPFILLLAVSLTREAHP